MHGPDFIIRVVVEERVSVEFQRPVADWKGLFRDMGVDQLRDFDDTSVGI